MSCVADRLPRGSRPGQTRAHVTRLVPVAVARRADGPNRNARTPRVVPAVTENLDNAERARLEATDAFKELVALNAKQQSRNKPQKVRDVYF